MSEQEVNLNAAFHSDLLSGDPRNRLADLLLSYVQFYHKLTDQILRKSTFNLLVLKCTKDTQLHALCWT